MENTTKEHWIHKRCSSPSSYFIKNFFSIDYDMAKERLVFVVIDDDFDQESQLDYLVDPVTCGYFVMAVVDFQA